MLQSLKSARQAIDAFREEYKSDCEFLRAKLRREYVGADFILKDGVRLKCHDIRVGGTCGAVILCLRMKNDGTVSKLRRNIDCFNFEEVADIIYYAAGSDYV